MIRTVKQHTFNTFFHIQRMFLPYIEYLLPHFVRFSSLEPWKTLIKTMMILIAIKDDDNDNTATDGIKQI